MQGPVEQAIEGYFLTIRQGWSKNTETNAVVYAADVYLARVLAAILTVPGIVNATGVLLNGESADLVLTETGARQEVPVLGTVTLHE